MLLLNLQFVHRRRFKRAQAAIETPITGRDETISTIHDDVREAELKNQSKKDSRSRTIADVYEGLRRSDMLVGDSEYATLKPNGCTTIN